MTVARRCAVAVLLVAVVAAVAWWRPWEHQPQPSDETPRPSPVAESVSVPLGMVAIRGGSFVRGTDADAVPGLMRRFGVGRRELFEAEIPSHTVTVSPFLMDQHEVTNEQFAAFLKAQPEWGPDRIPAQFHNGQYLKHWQGLAYPPEQAKAPVVYVCWQAAMACARWAGKRLPTEAEWEYAARGGLVGKAFPWGDADADPSRANYQASGINAVTRVGGYPPNGYGLYDMAGNAWEYCVDEWGPYAAGPQTDPVGGGSLYPGDSFRAVTTRRVIRGGSFGGSPVNLRVAYRDSHPPEGAGPHVGFRCIRPADISRRP